MIVHFFLEGSFVWVNLLLVAIFLFFWSQSWVAMVLLLVLCEVRLYSYENIGMFLVVIGCELICHYIIGWHCLKLPVFSHFETWQNKLIRLGYSIFTLFFGQQMYLLAIKYCQPNIPYDSDLQALQLLLQNPLLRFHLICSPNFKTVFFHSPSMQWFIFLPVIVSTNVCYLSCISFPFLLEGV